jgi:ectoine hydroxylase-related dioxygenase (phytanoyl-CoA dioxygenase family)
VISLPGSSPQDIHQDTQDLIQHKDAISFGIPLQDITPVMGPLIVRPTNGLDFFDVPTKQGDIYGWSQIIPHGGGANVSNTERWVLYFTVLYPPVLDIDVGGRYSLHPDYQPGILLRQLVD